MKVYRDLYFHLCALYNIWQIVKEKCTKTLFLNKWVQSHSLCFKDTVQSKGDGFIWFDTFCLLAVKTQVEKKEFCSQNPTVADGWRAAELVNSLVMKVWWDPISLISSSENQKIYIYVLSPKLQSWTQPLAVSTSLTTELTHTERWPCQLDRTTCIMMYLRHKYKENQSLKYWDYLMQLNVRR